MGLTERHWFENEDTPGNYERDLEDAVYNSRTNKKHDDDIVRCKDCKHRGIGNNDFPADIEWPDEECPYECSDPFYSWLPPDDWYCANGERKGTKV